MHQNAIAVIFEAEPAEGGLQEYLDIAAALRPELEKIKGFISIERFQSLYQPGKVLSLSFWEDETAVQQWRNTALHREAQSDGRDHVFKDYRIRVAQVVRDYGMHERAQAPGDSKLVYGE